MFITWKYDLFPYELCAKVIEYKGNNLYTVEGFNGMQFEAKRKILNDATGIAIKNKLKESEEKYREDLATLNDKHRKKIALELALMNGIK